jgi:hypothetical protein
VSGRISIKFVDFAAVLLDFDRVLFVSTGLFLVRNWCGTVPNKTLSDAAANSCAL